MISSLDVFGIGVKELLYVVAAAGLLSIAAVQWFQSKRDVRQRLSSPSPEKPMKPFVEKGRKPGEWISSPYVLPTPDPYPSWTLSTPPLPYRPFRHGPNYFITMGLRRIPPQEWIELDSELFPTLGMKKQRIRERGEKCCRTLPIAKKAAKELCEELQRYLVARYPGVYEALGDVASGDDGMRNSVTGEEWWLRDVDSGDGKGGVVDGMEMASRWIQDDLALMMEDGEGKYRLVAGGILLAGFWRLEDKIGMSLDDIHETGHVPGYERKLKKGMNNFFGRVGVEEMVGRHNYFIQVDDALPWSHSIGNEDDQNIGWFTAEKNKPIEYMYFRSERQTLRRLPKTGAVVFTIRTYFHPITEVAKEPYVPGRLASGIRSWDEDVAKYKGREMYEGVLLPYLDEMHRKQLEAGLEVEKEGDVVRYPY